MSVIGIYRFFEDPEVTLQRWLTNCDDHAYCAFTEVINSPCLSVKYKTFAMKTCHVTWFTEYRSDRLQCEPPAVQKDDGT